jgi:hypothetical protein
MAYFATIVVALAAATSATASTSSTSPTAKQFAALQRQVTSLAAAVNQLKGQVATASGVAAQVTTLQTNVNTLGATLTCRVAQIGTFEYSTVDLFALILDQPEPFVGQVVPDNGTCAQVGLSPPSPAADRYAPGGLSPEQAMNVALARELHVQP